MADGLDKKRGRPSTLETAARRTQIVRLSALGYRQQEVADRVGCSVSTVNTHLQKAKKELAEKRIDEMTVNVNRELVAVNALIEEAYDAWERSKEVLYTDEKDGQTKTRKTAGDVRYLKEVKDLMAQRQKLLGLHDKDARRDPPSRKLTPEQTARMEAILSAAEARQREEARPVEVPYREVGGDG